LDDVVGPRWEFAKRFVEGIGKLAGNTLGNHQKKTERLATKMSEAAGLAGQRFNHAAQDFEQLLAAESPRLGS
ncbi:hypothetical protein BHE74_00028876, partial [Ensete ventricosum]